MQTPVHEPDETACKAKNPNDPQHSHCRYASFGQLHDSTKLFTDSFAIHYGASPSLIVVCPVHAGGGVAGVVGFLVRYHVNPPSPSSRGINNNHHHGDMPVFVEVGAGVGVVVGVGVTVVGVVVVVVCG